MKGVGTMELIHGVSVFPSSPYQNQDITISYDGLLHKSGADQVYLHYGVDGWRNPTTIPMMRSASGAFEAMIRASARKEINFCFHDSAMNWDNNNGLDWTIQVH
ncbi:MAG TPA: carbohydrate-binding protein [Firmicutes bacterium]|nr:carbohydrate-binding protein [Bacillota bacterium]